MGTVAPVSSELAYLANSSSPLVTTAQGKNALSSALDGSPPQDTVQFSASALALQEVAELLAPSSSSAMNSNPSPASSGGRLNIVA